MPRYAYTARDRSGQSVSAMLEAPTRREALRLLATRGLQPLTVGEEGGGEKREKAKSTAAASGRTATAVSPPTAQSAETAVKLRRAQRLPFLQALYDLVASGLSAGEAVRLLGQRIHDPRLRALSRGLWERLGEGLPLSRAMGEYPGVFDASTISLIQAGEATGNLADVLQRLIQHFIEQNELRQKLLTAMAYPAFICLVAFGVILFFIFGLLPKLELLLSSLGGKLPPATRFLIDTSHFLISYGWVVAIGLALAASAFWRWRVTESGRVITDAWILRLPLAGPFAASATVMNFSQTLAVLLENGITTVEALRMTERAINNRTHRAAFVEATERVIEGESLSLALARTRCFPDLVLDRLAVGENTGNVVPSLKEIGRSHQKDLSHRLQVFTTVVSSAVLLFAFSFVGFIAYAIVSAVFALSASFKM